MVLLDFILTLVLLLLPNQDYNFIDVLLHTQSYSTHDKHKINKISLLIFKISGFMSTGVGKKRNLKSFKTPSPSQDQNTQTSLLFWGEKC